MKTIVAVDKNWGIGCENDLLFNLPLDMQHFRDSTLGKTVVMGKNTLLSLPNSKPLKNRQNIVLSAKGVDGEGFALVRSLDDLLEIVKGKDDVYIIGGASVYELLLPYCDEAMITKVDADGGADCFFPNLDEHTDWKLESESEWINDGDYRIRFCVYKRLMINPQGRMPV